MEDEKWLPVVGYAGYEVSNLGGLRTTTESLRAAARRGFPRVLKPFLNPNGYLQIGLYTSGKQRLTQVHRHVAMAFIGEPPEGRPHVNHIDLNKSNNCGSNLEWVSCLENMAHAFGAGRLTCADGYRKGKTLSPALALEIRRLASVEDRDSVEISAALGVPRASVLDVLAGRSWVPAGLTGVSPVGRGSSAALSPGKSRALTRENVKSIKALHAATGMLQREIAEMFGVTQTTVSAVLRGKSWKGLI